MPWRRPCRRIDAAEPLEHWRGKSPPNFRLSGTPPSLTKEACIRKGRPLHYYHPIRPTTAISLEGVPLGETATLRIDPFFQLGLQGEPLERAKESRAQDLEEEARWRTREREQDVPQHLRSKVSRLL